ncbi:MULTISPECIES: nickel pincer cofactor biosynthesis protein LarC [unclassified Prochlorococcus]|uniref:nickel pincer cofactor biosynthesis protein LarC n=1 Tax=unclassified Prochlorococcus TaxID=2627481 RepID=UPI0005338735|nr:MULTISPECIES: nickel pincer cofactor biosynthesis protein LarC [unclassified Prochlorococcus]KGG16472.1 hypothetical protein EV06_0310 [Prochlorococcus sp. MIT 0602]KGG17053.1 hypothetical protein EV07_0483 [Prochlorococcus sp. MIT 0603]
MKDLFIDCSNGVSGDMLLSSLLDLGVPLEVIHKPLELLGLDDLYSLRVEESSSFQLRGLKLFVEDNDKSGKHRTWIEIRTLIDKSKLNKSLKKKIIKVFEMLAEAESIVHGVDIDKVHFHELGSIDSLVDIIGVCSLVEYLKLKSIFCNFPPAGSGFVETSHGILPVPVPAVLELAKKYNLKLKTSDFSSGEVTTPTGFALIIALSDFFKQPNYFNINSVGIGLGHREIDRPNFLRVYLLENYDSELVSNSLNCARYEEVILQESWIDDSSAEDTSTLIDELRNSGALEVSSHSIQMKKGRMGLAITAISKKEDAANLRLIWFKFGTTIGFRERIEGRWVLLRRDGICSTRFGDVRVKQVQRPYGQFSIKIEHDELLRISLKEEISLEDARKEIILNTDTFSPIEEWN